MSFENILKLGAVASAMIYGILFIGYYKFYAHLRMAPEDAGISNAYVLVRSVGFIALMTISAIVVSSVIMVVRAAARDGAPRATTRFVFVALLVAALMGAAFVFVELFPSGRSAYGGIVVLVLGLCAWLFAHFRLKEPRSHQLAKLVGIGVVVFAVPALAVVARAEDMANRALAGEPVFAWEVLNVPVLDVGVPRVTVTWIGEDQQKPEAFVTDGTGRAIEGTLLGEGNGNLVLMISGQDSYYALSMPANMLAVEKHLRPREAPAPAPPSSS